MQTAPFVTNVEQKLFYNLKGIFRCPFLFLVRLIIGRKKLSPDVSMCFAVKEVTEHIEYEGGIVVCIESFFLKEPTKLMIETLEPSTIYAIPHDLLKELTRKSYDFCLLMFAFLEHSLIMSQRKADTLRFESAKERYLRTLKDHPDLIRRAPLHHVASYLQMTPETLSRVRTATNVD